MDTEQMLDNAILKDVAAKKVTPDAKRKAVVHACEVHGVSQRRACQALKIDRSTVRYASIRPDDVPLREAMKAMAAERRRFVRGPQQDRARPAQAHGPPTRRHRYDEAAGDHLSPTRSSPRQAHAGSIESAPKSLPALMRSKPKRRIFGSTRFHDANRYPLRSNTP